MEAIENFKLKTFLKKDKELIDKYVTLLQYLKPVETKKQLFHMSLKDVEYVKKNINANKDKELIKIVAMLQDIKLESVYKLPIVKFFGLLSSIKAQLKIISKAEENSLTSSETNIKWEMVEGAKRMAKFGIYNTLESLTGGDALKYKQYMDMEYSEVFTILYMRKETSELKKEMEGIKLSKE